MVIRSVHRLSRILLTCTAQVHIRLLTCSNTSVTFCLFSFPDVCFSVTVMKKIITILAFFHVVGIRFSDKHLVYSLASVFEMVSSPAFNVSMFMWLLSVLIFISRSAASTSHDVISGTSFESVWIVILCSLSYCSVSNSSIRSMILLIMAFSTLLVWECDLGLTFCILRTFLRLFDVIVVCLMISWSYFLMSSFYGLAYFYVLYSLFIVAPFLVVSSSELVLVTISSISVAS